MLKALLVAAGAAPPRSHDMELLIQAAAPLYPTLRKEMQAFARLTEWLTASRGLGEAPADVAEMLALIKAFGANVRALAPFRVYRVRRPVIESRLLRGVTGRGAGRRIGKRPFVARQSRKTPSWETG